MFTFKEVLAIGFVLYNPAAAKKKDDDFAAAMERRREWAVGNAQTSYPDVATANLIFLSLIVAAAAGRGLYNYFTKEAPARVINSNVFEKSDDNDNIDKNLNNNSVSKLK